MIPRRSLAALVCSIVSQLSILLALNLHRYPSCMRSTGDNETLVSLLIHHLLSSSHAAAAVSLKRKRISPTSSSRCRLVSREPCSFRAHFNMSPSTFDWLSDLLEPLLDCRDPAGSPLNLSPELRLGIGLYRFSTGSDYSDIGRFFRVPEAVARFCTKQLCRVLCTNFRFWLAFPNPKDLNSISQGFESLSGLPNCCGVIACVRFRIKSQSLLLDVDEEQQEEDQFIASQIVVDSNSRLLSIVAGFTAGDNSKVLKSSTLFKDIQSGRLLNSPPICVDTVDSVPQYFVGDRGYPLLPWLMVPFSDDHDGNPGSPQHNLDSALHLLRFPLLKTVASLRNWGVLSRPIEGELRNAVAYIGSCAILHNALLIRQDFSALCSDISLDDTSFEQGSVVDVSVDVPESIQRKAHLVRSALANMAPPTTSTTRE